PARHFVRGYRLNALDSLRVGAPLLLVLGVLGVNITQGGAVGTSALALLFLALGVLVLLALVRAVSIVSAFSFRMIDVLRLAIFTLLARPLATLALLSLGVLVLGIVLVIGEFLLLFTASLLVFALWASERPVAALLTERFVGSSQPSADDAAPAGPPPRDRDLEALPLELERVVAGEAAEREHSLCIAAQILALHPPVLAQQLPQRVVAGLGGAVRAEQPRGRPEPGPGVAQPPVRQRFDRRLREHGRVVAHELVRLP